MIKQDFTIRPYQKGDEFSINKSFNEVFGLNRTIEEWRWKFDPQNQISRIIVAVDKQNEVLAHYASLLVSIKVDQRIIIGAQNLDSFALNRSDVLKGRLFLKTAFKFIKEYGTTKEIPFFYGSNSGRILKLGKMLFKYTEEVPIEYLCKETFKLRRMIGLTRGQQIWEGVLLNYSTITPEAVDNLWERSKQRYQVTLIKDGSYIKKRYLTHPVRKYMYLPINDNDNSLAALAILLYENRLLKWVDLIWDGKNPYIIKELESKIWAITKRIGAIKVELWLNNDDQVKSILIDCGMKTAPNPYDLYITSRSFDENLNGDDITKRFYFTMGNSDIF